METLGDAARRLLAGLERAKKKASRSLKTPGENLEVDRPAPSVDKGAGEAAAISASFTGQHRRGNGRRDAITAANDNRRADLTSFPLRRVMPAVATRPYSDDSADQIARTNALLRLRAPSDWEW